MKNNLRRFYDAPYGGHERQIYDLVLPEKRCCGGLVLSIHGGAWIHGDKGYYRDELDEWAAKGYAAAAINYHYLSPDTHMDTLVHDITEALAAIKKTAAENGVTLSRALLTGASAGGHLSLLYAYAMADEAPIRPVCVVDYCGPTLLTDKELLEGTPSRYPPMEQWIELYSNLTGIPFRGENREEFMPLLLKYSPLHYVNEHSVPTIICHGQRDDVVPFSNATALRDALEAHGVEYVFLPMPKAGHPLEQEEIFRESRALFELYAERFLQEPAPPKCEAI
ncbi:MAG: alpha/beta hydrolase [Clostridia bacterium]|nr:alpha/beta hydrolase [Clostridia bacterium]